MAAGAVGRDLPKTSAISAIKAYLVQRYHIVTTFLSEVQMLKFQLNIATVYPRHFNLESYRGRNNSMLKSVMRHPLGYNHPRFCTTLSTEFVFHHKFSTILVIKPFPFKLYLT